MDNGLGQTEAAIQSPGHPQIEAPNHSEDACQSQGMCAIISRPVKPAPETPACRLMNERQRWSQTPDGSKPSPAELVVQPFQQLLSMHENDAMVTETAKTDAPFEDSRELLNKLQDRSILETLWKNQLQKTNLASSLGERAAQLSVRDVRLGGH
jgi:hypothetical protein